jgi:hypothetical protein
MTRWNKLIVSLAAAVAVAGAYASGWTVTVLTSVGVLNPGSCYLNGADDYYFNPAASSDFQHGCWRAGPDSGR